MTVPLMGDNYGTNEDLNVIKTLLLLLLPKINTLGINKECAESTFQTLKTNPESPNSQLDITKHKPSNRRSSKVLELRAAPSTRPGQWVPSWELHVVVPQPPSEGRVTDTAS